MDPRRNEIDDMIVHEKMQAALESFVRNHQIAVSNVALHQFMQTLFEEKLAAQKEALLQGKQLADIIEMQHALTASAEANDVDASGQRLLATASGGRLISRVRMLGSSRQRSKLHPLRSSPDFNQALRASAESGASVHVDLDRPAQAFARVPSRFSNHRP